MTGGPAPPRFRTARLAVLLLLAAAGVVLLFAFAMTRDVSYDEDQHLAAGYLARTLLPYRDFAYLQGPLYPMVLGALFRGVDGYYLLAARLLSFGLSVVSAGLLWALLRRLGAGRVLAAVLMLACLCSPFLTSALANTRNDVLPLALMLAGLWLHVRTRDATFLGQAGAALLLGLAAGAKVTYLFGPVALGLHALFAPGVRLAPVLLGTAIAAAPAAWFWHAAPEAFRFGLLDYHLAAPADWYGRQGMAALLTPGARLSAVADWALLGGNLTLVVLAAALSLVAVARRRNWKRPGPVLLTMLAGAMGLAFLPAPAWAMYWAPVAPLLACCVAHLDGTTRHLAGAGRKRILFAVAGVACLPALAVLAPDVLALRRRAGWAGLAAHDTALAIRAALPAGGPVATLFPHLVMDANPIRADLAAGPFVFRSAARFGPALLDRLHALDPARLDAAFAAVPPAAIYTGAFAGAWTRNMDAPLAAYAEAHGWRAVPVGPGVALLWLPPGQ